jgi:hypothetical protein
MFTVVKEKLIDVLFYCSYINFKDSFNAFYFALNSPFKAVII